MTRAARALALFDLDYTLLPVDSDFEWGDFLARKGIVDEKWFRRRNEEFFAQYKAGTIDMREFLAFEAEWLTGDWDETVHDRATLETLRDEYVRTTIEPRVRPEAVALVDEHRAAGALCAVVSATNAFVVAPIARRFGIEHVLATVPEQDDAGRFTGGFCGEPCFREGKLARVTEWLASMGDAWSSFASSTFYSDSRNDIALREHVTVPVATNADDALAAHAAARGWRTLSLFGMALHG